MTDNFIAFFYRERLLVAVVSMLIVAGGILALRRLNVDAFPDVTPVQGSQQMYQALRSLGIDTQLIIYPNENHGIQRPSYQRDRMERYLAWYDKYVKKSAGPSSTSTAQ